MPDRTQRRETARGWRAIAQGLSGRILLLTTLYLMVSAALVYFPSMARYHRELLFDRVASAELAILPFTEAPGENLSAELRTQLLSRAGVLAIVLRGGGQHELFLTGQEPPQIDAVYNTAATGFITEMRDVIRCLTAAPGRIVRIDASAALPDSPSIFVVANEDSIRADLLTFSYRALAVSLFIAGVTALLVFLSLYLILVRPMKRLTDAMVRFRADPEDPSRIHAASARRDEIGIAERELSAMQRDIFGFLQQKSRLAQLGTAVAKIQHDLRNILASAQIASDRLATSDDPVVRRVTPRLIHALDRAISLATNTLRYGKAEEREPERKTVTLAPMVEEVAASAIPDSAEVAFEYRGTPDLKVNADPDQLYRVLLNLVTNAREALERMPPETRPEGRRVRVEARRVNGSVAILIYDNGPGIDLALREKLFRPFASASRSKGTGLGLAIARELMQAHGGDVDLVHSGETGTQFRIIIPERPGA